MPATQDAPCLPGLRVVECGRLAAVPFCGRLLAGLGAEVIKVEPPQVGDPARRRPPFAGDQPGLERSLLFMHANGGKASVTLDLEAVTGRRLLNELLRGVDVLVHDFGTEEARTLGLDYASLASDHPRLVVAAVTPFGSDGPHSAYKAHDLNVYHMGGDGYLMPSGLAHELFPEREPVKMAGYTADFACGVAAATAIVGALMARLVTGRGQLVDLSKQDIHTSMCREQLLWYANENVLETRETRAMSFGGCFQCRDGYVQIYVFTDGHWDGLLKLMGDPEWASAERFQTLQSRAEHGAEINVRIREWAIHQSRDDLYRRGQALGATVGTFNTPADVLIDPHEQERGFFVQVDQPEIGSVTQPSWPFWLSETPARLLPAPRLGQDTERVLGGLGVTAEDLVAMRRVGVI